MADFCVLGRGGFGVSTLKNCAVGGAGAWGTAMLNMAASCLSAIVFFSPRCEMGMDGVGCCSSSVRSAATLVISSAGDSLGKIFWDGNSLVVSHTCSDAVLGMYDVRHL